MPDCRKDVSFEHKNIRSRDLLRPRLSQMANATYDNLWQTAMGELSEQLHVEGVDDGEDDLDGGGHEVSIAVIYLLSKH